MSAIQMESASTGSLQLELGVLKEELAKFDRGAEVLKVGASCSNLSSLHMLELHDIGLWPR